jgi:hypothetical protein
MVTEERLKRNKDTQEFFTPDWAVKMMVDEVPDSFFKELKPFGESGCGIGNIAIQVYNRYRVYHSHNDTMSVMKLSDILEDNCVDCIKRFYGPGKIEAIRLPQDYLDVKGLISFFTWNGKVIDSIVQADGTKYQWQLRKKEFKHYLNSLKRFQREEKIKTKLKKKEFQIATVACVFE